MGSDHATPRSRRALLTAAAGAAGALAAQAAMPLAAAADDDPVLVGGEYESASPTSITQAAGGSIAFKGRTANTDAAGVVGSTGDETDIAPDTSWTGVYGWSPTGGDTGLGVGVWGDSADFGVYGTGMVGVYGYGAWGVIGESGDPTTPGVLAYGYDANSPALEVQGKVKFSRSGRKAVLSGKSNVVVTLAGVTAYSKVFAVFATSEPGRYVRAVVPATGKFTVVFNTTLTSSAVVSWFVLD